MIFEEQVIYVVFYSKVYDIITEMINMKNYLPQKSSFILAHMPDAEYRAEEYRFGAGCLGFGCKYRLLTNSIDYYPEDHDVLGDNLCKEINEKLSNLLKEFKSYI